MNTSLNKILASLPDDTIVYPGHEYTKSNAKFAISVLKDRFTENLWAFSQENEETQGKFTIADEKVSTRPNYKVITNRFGRSIIYL